MMKQWNNAIRKLWNYEIKDWIGWRWLEMAWNGLKCLEFAMVLAVLALGPKCDWIWWWWWWWIKWNVLCMNFDCLLIKKKMPSKSLALIALLCSPFSWLTLLKLRNSVSSWGRGGLMLLSAHLERLSSLPVARFSCIIFVLGNILDTLGLLYFCIFLKILPRVLLKT